MHEIGSRKQGQRFVLIWILKKSNNPSSVYMDLWIGCHKNTIGNRTTRLIHRLETVRLETVREQLDEMQEKYFSSTPKV